MIFKNSDTPTIPKSTSSSNPSMETLIGRQTEIIGDVKFSGGLHLDGVVHGAVTAKGEAQAHLSVSDSGRVEGEVRVPTIVLNGSITGDVYAGEKITMGAKSRITGNVVYKALEMQVGAQVNGRLTHESAVQAAITHEPTAPHAPVGGLEAGESPQHHHDGNS